MSIKINISLENKTQYSFIRSAKTSIAYTMSDTEALKDPRMCKYLFNLKTLPVQW